MKAQLRSKLITFLACSKKKRIQLTTTIRIVYYCSCRQSPHYASENDYLMPISTLLNDLTKILMRFLLNKIVVSADTEKAFHHVG